MGTETDDDNTEVVRIESTFAPTDERADSHLADGDIVLLGRLPYSSNAVFLAEVTRGEDRVHAIYKPERGERALWDFPPGLWRRERAACVLDRMLGAPAAWPALVPPTVVRTDAPLGVGSLQFWVTARYDEHYFVLLENESNRPVLRRLAALDIVMNNTDRKGGHVLIDDVDHLWAIDNGLILHEEEKLRTVIWDFADEPIGDDTATALGTLLDTPLPDELDELTTEPERDALRQRAANLLAVGRFPVDHSGRRYPWPLI